MPLSEVPLQLSCRPLQLSGLLHDSEAWCDGWQLEKHALPLSKGFGWELPLLPTLLPPPRQTKSFFWLPPTPSIGAEPAWGCGEVGTSPGSLERLCLLRWQSEGCTMWGGEAHSPPLTKIARFFHNRQWVLHMSPRPAAAEPQPCWQWSVREERLKKGKRCLAFQAKNTGCASKIILVE